MLCDMVNREIWTGPGSVYPENGWVKECVWQYHNGGQWGDLAIMGYTAYYSKPGTNWQAEISYYIEEALDIPEGEGVKYIVECMTEIHQRDGENGPTYNEDITYDYGSVLYYDSIEDALDEALRLVRRDESYAFNV